MLSTGSPRRLKTRPRHPSPTGTEIGAPVSTASAPLASPSVELMAMQRTTSSPICCATSATSFRSPTESSMALFSSGSSPSANRISRTGPVTCITFPLCCSLISCYPFPVRKCPSVCYAPSAPATISVISCVMLACRARL